MSSRPTRSHPDRLRSDDSRRSLEDATDTPRDPSAGFRERAFDGRLPNICVTGSVQTVDPVDSSVHVPFRTPRCTLTLKSVRFFLTL